MEPLMGLGQGDSGLALEGGDEIVEWAEAGVDEKVVTGEGKGQALCDFFVVGALGGREGEPLLGSPGEALALALLLP